MIAYQHEASWAVWDTDGHEELTGEALFPLETARRVAHGRAMIVSLNPASERRAAPGTTAAWSNFHSPDRKHNDLFLARAFHQTRYWGAFMTDLHPNLADPNSRNVVLSKRNATESAVRSLVHQAELLGEVADVICVGGATFAGISRHAALIEAEIGVPASRLLPIPHYSGMASRVHGNKPDTYRRIVHDALDLN